MIAVVALVGCGPTKREHPKEPTGNEVDPNAPANITDPIVEKEVRKSLKKPTGELTNADLAKVTELNSKSLTGKIPDAGLKDVAKLQQLTTLGLVATQITDAGMAELRKALPECKIYH